MLESSLTVSILIFFHKAVCAKLSCTNTKGKKTVVIL